MNKKFTALWMLMFASSAGNLMAPPSSPIAKKPFTLKSQRTVKQELSGDHQINLLTTPRESQQQPSLGQKLYNSASSVGQSINSSLSFASQKIGEASSATGNAIRNGVQMANRGAYLLGREMGIPNLTARTINLTTPIDFKPTRGKITQDNYIVNTKTGQERAIEPFIGQLPPSIHVEARQNTNIKTVRKQQGEQIITTRDLQNNILSQTFIPAPGYANAPARAIRSAASAVYKGLQSITSPESRQAFVENVTSIAQNIGSQMKAIPGQIQSGLATFFASITPNMSMPDFSARWDSFLKSLGVRSSAPTENASGVEAPQEQSKVSQEITQADNFAEARQSTQQELGDLFSNMTPVQRQPLQEGQLVQKLNKYDAYQEATPIQEVDGTTRLQGTNRYAIIAPDGQSYKEYDANGNLTLSADY